MFKKKISFGQKSYEVKLTRRAMLIIEEEQKNKLSKMLNDNSNEELFKNSNRFTEMMKRNEEIEKIEDEKKREAELSSLIVDYMDVLLMMNKSNLLSDDIAELSSFEVVKILIQENPKNPTLSDKDFEKLLDEYEEENGLEQLYLDFDEMKEKVFIDMGNIQKALSARNKPSVAPKKVVMGKA